MTFLLNNKEKLETFKKSYKVLSVQLTNCTFLNDGFNTNCLEWKKMCGNKALGLTVSNDFVETPLVSTFFYKTPLKANNGLLSEKNIPQLS